MLQYIGPRSINGKDRRETGQREQQGVEGRELAVQALRVDAGLGDDRGMGMSRVDAGLCIQEPIVSFESCRGG